MKLILIALVACPFFFVGQRAHAFSVSQSDFLKLDTEEAQSYLVRQRQASAALTFNEYEGSDAVFTAIIDPRCTVELRVVHTPIPHGIGNAMVTRSVRVGDSKGTCAR